MLALSHYFDIVIVVSMLCEGSETLTEGKSENVTEGRNDRGR